MWHDPADRLADPEPPAVGDGGRGPVAWFGLYEGFESVDAEAVPALLPQLCSAGQLCHLLSCDCRCQQNCSQRTTGLQLAGSALQQRRLQQHQQ